MSRLTNLNNNDVLVENIRPYQSISEYGILKEIDLYTVKTEDLSFESAFHLRILHDDCVNGLFTFFEVYFTSKKLPHSKLIRLSTG